MTSTASNNGNPFPGLRSFEREQAHLFFGRDEQTRELILRLQQHRFLPIVGMSGSGKSSLVRAGLIPTLTGSYDGTETSGWRIALLRPGRNPMQELAATLSSEFGLPESDTVLKTLRGSSAGLARVAQEHVAPEEKLLVLVDQFEELFRYGEEGDDVGEADDDEAFVKLLLAAAGKSEHPLPGFDDVPVYVVTTMRSDFLGKCSRFRGLPEALNQSQYLIPRLTREQQRDAIEGPVGMAGSRIEPALVQQLLNDLGDDPDQLPALQHALMRSWEHSAESRAQGKPIAVTDYEAIGGMADALNLDADRVYESLSSYEAAIARSLFQRLVMPGAADGETRSPTPLSELVAITVVDEEIMKQIIDVFKNRGFLTVSTDKDPIIDIPHESLIRGWGRLKTWVQEEEESSKIYCRLADTAALHARNRAYWFVDPELQTTLNWREQQMPNEAWARRYDPRFAQAIEFLEQSQKEQVAAIERNEQQRRSELKRARRTALVLGSLLLLGIAASVVAFINWQRTRTERDRSNRLLYDSNVYFASSAVASGQATLARQRLTELLDAGLGELRGFEWFYLWRTLHGEEATLERTRFVYPAVAFSPNGRIIATASDRLKLWDAKTRKELGSLSADLGYLSSLAFSPDGNILASASIAPRSLKLWDTTAGRELATLGDNSSFIQTLTFSPDGKILAASHENVIRFWDTATYKEVATLSGHSQYIRAVAFSPDGKILASASEDDSVKLWDTTTHTELSTLSGNSGFVQSIAFSPDGKILACAGSAKSVKLWDVATRKEVAILYGDYGYVMSLAFSPDGKTLASASNDTIKLWDFGTRKVVAILSGHSDSVGSVVFSPDGKTLASAGNDNTVKLWDTTIRKELTTLSGHFGFLRSVAFSPDGKTLASSTSHEKAVKLWDAATRTELAGLVGHSKPVMSLAFSPDGKTIASASNDSTVKLWDTVTRKEVATLAGHSYPVKSVAFSPDGKTLASADDSTVRLWDAVTGKELRTISQDYFIATLAFSPDGKILAFNTSDRVKLWDTTSHEEVGTLHQRYVNSIAFSPNSRTLACASEKTVTLWDTSTRELVTILSGHSDYVQSIAFSPDGKTLASASDDNTVKLWDTASGEELATLSSHSAPVKSLAFSPDGKILATASDDGTVKLWFAATEQEVEERRQRGY